MSLVLGRRLNESLLIGGNVCVRVVRIGRDNVRLAIDAPANVHVLREEIEVVDGSQREGIAAGHDGRANG